MPEEEGKGAKMFWRPVVRMVKGEGGGMGRLMGRQSYYVCDLGLRGRGKLCQSRLSFKKTNSLEDNPDVQDETFLDDNTVNKFA